MIVTIIKKVKRSFTAEISSDFVFFLSISKYIKQKWKTFSCYTLQIFSHYWRNSWRQSAKVFANVNRISRLWWLALTTWNPFEKKNQVIRQDSVACGNCDFSGVTTFQVWPGLGLVERYQLGGGNIAKKDDTPTVRLKPTLIRVYLKMFCQQWNILNSGASSMSIVSKIYTELFNLSGSIFYHFLPEYLFKGTKV